MDTPIPICTNVRVINARTPQTEFLVGKTVMIAAYRNGQYAVWLGGKLYGPFRDGDFESI